MFENFGFYAVDIDYVKYLHSKDNQVFYNASAGYDKKPYLGIIVGLNDFKYCIPLTSAKPKQLNWRNITEHNYLIYEYVRTAALHTNDLYKQIGDDTYKKFLAVLEIRKMIPVNDSLYSYIEFAKIADPSYLALLQKEYRFLLPYKDAILSKAKTLYKKQKETGVIKNCYCNFILLETALGEYDSQ